MFTRPMYTVLGQRLAEPRRFLQVLVGPRQTGKTPLAQQLMAGLDMPSHYASADEPALKDRVWIEQQWEVARTKTRVGDQKQTRHPKVAGGYRGNILAGFSPDPTNRMVGVTATR